LKRRLIYGSLSILCFIACFLIVSLFNDNHFIRGFVGDIIVILLVYFLIKIFYNFPALKLTIFILGVAFSTELLQYFRLTTFLGLEHNTIAKLILGSVFDPYDLLAYTLGAVMVYNIDTRLIKGANISVSAP
jgi:hypothetical protein